MAASFSVFRKHSHHSPIRQLSNEYWRSTMHSFELQGLLLSLYIPPAYKALISTLCAEVVRENLYVLRASPHYEKRIFSTCQNFTTFPKLEFHEQTQAWVFLLFMWRNKAMPSPTAVGLYMTSYKMPISPRNILCQVQIWSPFRVPFWLWIIRSFSQKIATYFCSRFRVVSNFGVFRIKFRSEMFPIWVCVQRIAGQWRNNCTLVLTRQASCHSGAGTSSGPHHLQVASGYHLQVL